jgi:hypothetical protein
MKNIENIVSAAEEKNNEYLEAKELLVDLKKELKIESDSFIKSGFPVDESLRLDPNKFKDLLYNRLVVENHNKLVTKKSREFSENKDSIGELLEASKTLSINRFWLGGEFVAVRASQFDDYTNGVDELLIHKESNTVVAAIDSTTDILSKADKSSYGNQKSLTAMLKEGAEVAYGVKLENGYVVKLSALKNLPIFIVNFNRQETIELAKDVLNHKISPLEDKLKESLIKQAELFSQNCSSIMKPHYIKAGKIFKSIKNK